MNQLISSAVGEKLGALMPEDHLAQAGRGSRRRYRAVLRGVPNIATEERDAQANNGMKPRKQSLAKPNGRR